MPIAQHRIRYRRTTIAIVLLLFTTWLPSRAQSSWIQVSGSNRFRIQVADQRNTFQEYRPFFWEWIFEPTVTVAHLPISFYLLLSSERQEFRQNINAVTGLFEPENVKQQLIDRIRTQLEQLRQDPELAALASAYDDIRDSLAQVQPEKLAQVEKLRRLEQLARQSPAELAAQLSELEQLDVISSVERFLLYLPKIEVGTVYPRFSPLSLNSVALDGVSVDWTPGSFHASFASGTTRQPIIRTDSIQQSSFGQRLHALRFGIFHSPSDFVALGILSGKEDTESLPDTVVPVTGGPYATHVLELQAGTELISRRLFLSGAVATSLVTWDLRSPYVAEERFPRWLTRFLELRLSSSWDLAYTLQLRTTLPETGTQVHLRAQMVGPGFRTFGNPVLRTDWQQQSVQLQQHLWKRRVALRLRYSEEKDNILGTKPVTTRTQRMGGQLRLRLPRLPTLFIAAHRSAQRQDTLVFATDLWRVMLSYPLRIGRTGLVTLLNYSQQTQQRSQRFVLHTFTANQILSFAFPLQLQLDLFYTVPTGDGPDTTIGESYQVQLMPSYTFSPNFALSLSLGFGVEQSLRNYAALLRGHYRLGALGTLFLEAAARLYSDPALSEYFLQLRFEQQW